MRDWRKILDFKKVLVLDGAWGTEMIKRGLLPGECPELWNVSHPDRVRAIAASYVDAGSDIILTNTFGASSIKLRRAGAEKQAGEINKRGVELSREVSGRSLVFASIGPTGEFMSPVGTITEKELISSFAEQVRAFAEAGADGVVVETMTDLGEATCAVKAVRENSALPVAVSMTFDKGRGGFATIMGVPPEKAATELEKIGVDITGSNCGGGARSLLEVAGIMKGFTNLPLWIKPNAGMPVLEGGKTVYRETPEEMAGFAHGLLEIGVSFIGGCCGTTPAHIAEIKGKIFHKPMLSP